MRDLVAALLRDVRFGFRILLRSPVITASVVIVLALGIGANAAMFSIVDGLLLHPVSYPQPETLAFVWSHDSQGSLRDASAADFMDWRAQAKSLSDFAAWMPTSFVLTGGDRPRQISGARVSANFFRTLGVTPERGRAFLPARLDGVSAEIIHPPDGARLRHEIRVGVVARRFRQHDAPPRTHDLQRHPLHPPGSESPGGALAAA